jgi:hypothetical protein
MAVIQKWPLWCDGNVNRRYAMMEKSTATLVTTVISVSHAGVRVKLLPAVLFWKVVLPTLLLLELGCQLLSCCDNDSNWFPIMTGLSTTVLLRQRHTAWFPVKTWMSTVVLLWQQQQTDFRLWLGCQLLTCCDNNSNWFPVIAFMLTAVLLQQHHLWFWVIAVMSTTVLLRQQQLISGYGWDVNCSPVATTSTDFRV